MKRLFCAVKVHPNKEIQDAIELFREELAGERIKWVNPDNLHLTQKFFGDTHADKEAEIVTALQKVRERIAAFSFYLAGFGYFGSHRSPRVLWIGIKQPEGLQKLYEEVNNHLNPPGYTPDKQHFVPHLTMGRIKEIHNINRFHNLLLTHKDDLFGVQQIESFTLYQSILRPRGPEYRVVNRWALIG